MPFMEMLTRLEDAHKEFETLMADDYEKTLSAIIPKVNQQVGMMLKMSGQESAGAVPTAILVMKIFEKDLRLESGKWKIDNKEIVAKKEELEKSLESPTPK